MPGSEFELRTDDGQSLGPALAAEEGAGGGADRPRTPEHNARYAASPRAHAAGYAVYTNDNRGRRTQGRSG